MTRPLITVGIPVYNGAEFIGEALVSVLEQDYPALEVVVSDNCSTDGTEEVVRGFVHSDSRVRYLLQPENRGPGENFRQTFAAANGTYFSWLAHDDVLEAPAYLTTLAYHLERNPGTTACTSSFVLRNIALGRETRVDLTELDPTRPWREGRRGFFMWPQQRLSLATYSLFRRSALARAPIGNVAQGAHSLFSDMPILATVATLGRVDAVVGPARAIRQHLASEAQRILRSVSPYDMLRIGLQVKRQLLRCALKAPLPPAERLELTRVAAANFWRANLRRPWDYARLVRALEAERDALLAATGAAGDSQPPRPARRRRGPVASFFTPPAPETVAYVEQLHHAVAELWALHEPSRGTHTSLTIPSARLRA
jgi:Glycosyl transferase family 2